MKQIIECVPNYSEGRNLEIVEKIVECFRAKEGLKLLNYSSDKDHNRTVVTVVGEREVLKEAVLKSVEVARDNIDLRKQSGEHPRMGAVDVIPFIPIKNATMDDCVELSREVASEMFNRYNVPTFLYEKSATAAHRQNLANLRKGEFEGMAEKIKTEEFKPDYGEELHESYGITAVGARAFLVAYNINLGTNDISIANNISKKVRHSGGGLRFVKAMGVKLEERGIVQVSMNCTDFTKTSLYTVFETVKMEARRYGVNVVGSEVIGLVPMSALIDASKYYLQIENFGDSQVLESNFLE